MPYDSEQNNKTVDEVLADPARALGMPDGAIPVHCMVICQYMVPGSNNHPGRPRIAYTSDADMPPWIGIGMASFASDIEQDEYHKDEDDD